MPWLNVNQARLSRLTAVPRPLLALDVQRAGMPGHPGANTVGASATAAPLEPRTDEAGHSPRRRSRPSVARRREPVILAAACADLCRRGVLALAARASRFMMNDRGRPSTSNASLR